MTLGRLTAKRMYSYTCCHRWNHKYYSDHFYC